MPFLLSSDKTVINAVDQAVWSPGKDLIACLTQDSQLHAYREFPSFQRIWALSFQSAPVAMCWRPDGIRLAVGHEDGSISIIDAENGNTEMQTRPQKRPIACLAWASAPLKRDSEAKLTHDMWARYTRHCPWTESTDDIQAGRSASVDAQFPAPKQRDFEVLDILCSADTAGEVCCAAFGHYIFLRFKIPAVLSQEIDGSVGPTPDCVPQQMVFCPGLSRLFVTYGTSSDTSQPGTQGMVACSLLMLSSRLKEFHCLLIIASALRHHLAACKAGMLRLDRNVQSARKSLIKVLSQFEVEGVIHTESAARWPEVRGALCQQLQALFSRGTTTPELVALLATRPGEHGLKQAARTIDASLSAAHAAAVQLRATLQGATSILEDLGGIIAGSAALADCGIHGSEVRSTKADALRLLVRLESTQRMVTDTARLHRAFFQELVLAARTHAARAAQPGGAPPAALSADSAMGGDVDKQHALQTFLSYHCLADPLMDELKGGSSMPEDVRSAAFSVDRRPLAPRNQDTALRLMSIALGHGEPPKPEALPPLGDAVHALAERGMCLFEGFPQVLQRAVQPLCKVSLGPAAGVLPTCSTPHFVTAHLAAADAAEQDPLSHTRCTVAMQVCCALRQPQPDSVAHIELQYSPQEARFASVRGAVLDVCQAAAGRVVVEAHPFRNGALVLLTQAADAVGAQHQGGKDTCQGELALVPCPFQEDRLVELNASIQDDVLQVVVGQGGVVRLETIEGIARRATPSGQVNPPLAVSAARGLAAVCAEQRVTVYDLAEADSEEEDEEGGEGAEATMADAGGEAEPRVAAAPGIA